MTRSQLTFAILFSAGLFIGGAERVSAQTPTPTSTLSASCCSLAPSWTGPTLVGGSGGVAVDTLRNRVYFADTSAAQIKALNYDGTAAAAFGGGSVAISTFAVATRRCANDGVYSIIRVPDPSSITKFNPNGSLAWTSPPSIAGSARGLCLDDLGNIYVTSDTNSIQVFDPSGNQQQVLTGSGPLGPLNFPTGVFMEGLNLYVADTLNNRVVKFVETGINTYLYTMAQEYVLGFPPYGIAMDSNGYFYITCEGLDGYSVFDNNFNQVTTWCIQAQTISAFTIALDQTGAIYVTGLSNPTVAKMASCYTQTTAACLPTPTPYYQGSNPPASGECFLYPSPVRGNQATLSYRMAGAGKVELKVWNEKAELVASVTDQKQAGVQVTPFNVAGFASGVYFYSVVLTYNSGQVEKLKPRKFAIIH
jgi:sugar lactone lactonase YvrE